MAVIVVDDQGDDGQGARHNRRWWLIKNYQFNAGSKIDKRPLHVKFDGSVVTTCMI